MLPYVNASEYITSSELLSSIIVKCVFHISVFQRHDLGLILGLFHSALKQVVFSENPGKWRENVTHGAPKFRIHFGSKN